MAFARIGRGGTITRDARYRDGTGMLVDPVTPFVEIRDPGGTIRASGVPVRMSVGVYTFAFTVPLDGALGNWEDRWYGTINGEARSGADLFTVVEAGEVVVGGGEPTYPEAEGAIKAWVTTLALVGSNVRFGRPSKPSFPLLTLRRVGGVPLDYVPVDAPRIQFDLYGATPGSKFLVASLATRLESEIQALEGGVTPMGIEAVCIGAQVAAGPTWNPTDTDDARYTLDGVFWLRRQ